QSSCLKLTNLLVCLFLFQPDTGVINVQSALYGRADRETCSEGKLPLQLNNVECSQQGTLDVLKTRCDGRRVCEINTNLIRTSNPCFGTYKYLETTYTCNPATHSVTCEHSLAHLQCYLGRKIFVYGAHYGRHDRTTCSYQRPTSQIQNVACSIPASQVAQRCNGKTSCTIKVSNSVFGDPCGDTYKYLEVAYICQCKWLTLYAFFFFLLPHNNISQTQLTHFLLIS
uniref:SUEL-type lectin domain-containing protein n=1 Tax=Sphaeramia orbicularis TaxID=375764 RepID=A0A672ZM32_9TELE